MTADLKNSANFGIENVVLVKKYLTGGLGLDDINMGQICKNVAVLLLYPNIRPRFLPLNAPNMGSYGQNYYPGTCSKCQDPISQKSFRSGSAKIWHPWPSQATVPCNFFTRGIMKPLLCGERAMRWILFDVQYYAWAGCWVMGVEIQWGMILIN